MSMLKRIIYSTVIAAFLLGAAPVVQAQADESILCSCTLQVSAPERKDCSINEKYTIQFGAKVSLADIVVDDINCQGANELEEQLLEEIGEAKYDRSITVTEQNCTSISETHNTEDYRFSFSGCTPSASIPDPKQEPRISGTSGRSGTGSGGGSKADPGSIKLINPIGGESGNPKGITDLRIIAGNLIAKALTVMGSITFVVFVVGGLMWVTSAGNAERVKKGTTTMIYAVIGVFVIFSSYAILNTILVGLQLSEPGRIIPTSDSGSGSGGTSGDTVIADCSSFNAQNVGTNIGLGLTGIPSIGTVNAIFSCTAKSECNRSADARKILQESISGIFTTSGVNIKNKNGNKISLDPKEAWFIGACPDTGKNTVCCIDNSIDLQSIGDALSQDDKRTEATNKFNNAGLECNSRGEKQTIGRVTNYGCYPESYCQNSKDVPILSSNPCVGAGTEGVDNVCCAPKELSNTQKNQVAACEALGAGYGCRDQDLCQVTPSRRPSCPGGRGIICCSVLPEPEKTPTEQKISDGAPDGVSSCDFYYDGLSCLPLRECNTTEGAKIFVETEFGSFPNAKNKSKQKLTLNRRQGVIRRACDLRGQGSKYCCLPKE